MTHIDIDGRGPVARLRAGSSTDWDAAVGHPFVDQLFAGTLSDEDLAGYLVQDYQFFESFVAMLGACVAHADRLDARLRFARQLGFLAAEEDTYFTAAFAELGVPGEQYTSPGLSPTTAAFRALMDDAVTSASYSELLVVLVVAEWLYLEWGERSDPLPERDILRGWIDLHRGADFRSWVEFLVAELERVHPDVSAPGHCAFSDHLERVWNSAVRLEREFFDVALARPAHPCELSGTTAASRG